MSSTFTVETGALPSFTDLLAAAEIGEPVQLSGAGWTGMSWPRGLFAKIADAATMPSAIELTPELEGSFTRAGLAGSFLAYVVASARGVVLSRMPTGVTFSVLALSSADDYRLAIRLAATTARLAKAKVRISDDASSTVEELEPDEALARFGAAFAEENARQVGTWLAEDVAQGRTYWFQGPRGFTKLAPEELRDVPKEQRLARAREILRGEVTPLEVIAADPRREAVLLTAAMVFAAGADGRLDDEEARQLEAHFATIKELGRYPARELLDAVKSEVPSIDALRELGSKTLRRKAFVLAGEVIASAQGGKLGGDPSDPNVKAISALATALGLDTDQTFIARVVTAVMPKYAAVQVDDAIARSFVLGMLLAAAADGQVDAQEAALLSALARTVPDLRSRDVEALFEAARTRMNDGLETALTDLDALGGHENKCFALAAEVALVAGHGEAGTMLPRLRDHIRPEPGYADCAIATFAAKYA
jgi:uncharacterized membrane protein YebE (DUF533 family)